LGCEVSMALLHRLEISARGPGAALLGTARWWRGIVPFTHLARKGAHDSHHRTARIAGRTRRRGGCVAARGARAAGRARATHRRAMLYPENDPEGQLRATALRNGLQKRGWAVGGNVEIDFQWGFGDADWVRSAGAQLLRSAPDVILANGTPAARTMQQLTRTVPVIFIAGSDPVVDGLVMSLARPGGNLTLRF